MIHRVRSCPNCQESVSGVCTLHNGSRREVRHIDDDPINNNIDNLELRMTTQEERDQAVIARRKAGERRHIAAIAGTTEWVHDRPNLNDGRLPEAAFDWPIYRAALSTLYRDGDGEIWAPPDPDNGSRDVFIAASESELYRAALRPTLIEAAQVLDDEIGLPTDVLATIERKRSESNR